MVVAFGMIIVTKTVLFLLIYWMAWVVRKRVLHLSSFRQRCCNYKGQEYAEHDGDCPGCVLWLLDTLDFTFILVYDSFWLLLYFHRDYMFSKMLLLSNSFINQSSLYTFSEADNADLSSFELVLRLKLNECLRCTVHLAYTSVIVIKYLILFPNCQVYNIWQPFNSAICDNNKMIGSNE